MEKYTRKAVFSELKKYDFLAGEHDFIEVVEWYNGEGFDVQVSGKINNNFSLTWGQFTALKKTVKTLSKEST